MNEQQELYRTIYIENETHDESKYVNTSTQKFNIFIH